MTERVSCVYADYASTTTPSDRAVRVMNDCLTEQFGNPSSIHSRGGAALRVINEAREKLARLIDCSPDEVIFTSGGTEADNWAVRECYNRNVENGASKRVVLSAIEHPAVLKCADELEGKGAAVIRLAASERDELGRPTGRVPIEAFDSALKDGGAAVVSLMAVNNETGVIQRVREAADLAHNCGALFHCDAVAAVGHIPVSVRELGCDCMSISGHKLHAPCGIGALYVRGGSIAPMMVGGGQERGRRSGTEPVALIAAFGEACAEAYEFLEEESVRISALRDYIEGELLRIPGSRVNGSARRVPGITNISFDGVGGEALALQCDIRGVCLSNGSACHSASEEPSHVLVSMGVEERLQKGAIRISIGRYTTAYDAESIVRAVSESVDFLRKMA